MKNNLLLVVAMAAITWPLLGQSNFKAYLDQQHDKKIQFQAQQQAFRQWFSRDNLTKTRGYKQFKRAEYYHESRQPTHRLSGIPSTAYRETATRQQRRIDLRQPQQTWTPLGPTGVHPSPQPYELRGVGRVNVVRFHPTEAGVFFVGAASGGVWKTENDGQSWIPLGDQLPILRISDIAIDPQHPDTMYVCLGDIYTGFVNVNNLYPTNFGEGIYKTTDGGATWQPTGLLRDFTLGQFSLFRKLIVHPERTNELLAVGFSGAWKSTNHGDTWERVVEGQIFLDLVADPDNPEQLFASTSIFSSTVWRSEDFGGTWEALETGMPQDGSIIRIALAIAPSNPDYIYALAAANTGGLQGVYRSTDGGVTWELRMSQETGPNILAWFNGDPELLATEAFGQGEYDLTLLVNPYDENEVYSGGINVWGSTDGGTNWDVVSFPQSWFGPTVHQDIHHINHNPLDGKYYVCNDGGIDRTDSLQIGDVNFAIFNCLDPVTNIPFPDCYELPTQWESLSDGLAITELYRIGLANGSSDRFMAGSQDNSVFLRQNGEWTNIMDGDGMECLIDPNDPNVLYGGMELGRLELSYDGGQTITDEATAAIFDDPTQFPAWVTPLVMHPTETDKVYIGFSDVWLSEDRGQTWSKVSDLPVIAPGEPGLPMRSLAIAPSNPATMYLTRQPFFLENLTLPGEMWKTEDDGATWTNITGNLPTEIVLNDIAIDADDPATVWVSCSNFVAGTKVFKTTDGGATWVNISQNLPNLPVNSIVHQPGSARNTVYAGTDRGVYYRHDDLEEWLPLGEDLPNVIVQELEVDPVNNKLLAATFGRGVWVTDLLDVATGTHDNNPLENLDWRIMPSPGNGNFTVALPVLEAQMKLNVEIVDMLGRTRHYERAQAGEGASIHFSLQLPGGIYFVRLSNGRYSTAKKFIIQ